MTAQAIIPDGYMENAIGHLVPVQHIREQDKLRDTLVHDLVEEAMTLSDALKRFKARALSDIGSLIEIAADRYDVHMGGKKGNVSLVSYNGKYKVQRVIAERLAFSEEIEAAKLLILACIDRWTAGANVHAQALVNRAFKTTHHGQLKTSAILDLLRLDIDDPQWQRAMDALKTSILTSSTAIYVRVYEREDNDKNYRLISLDLASV